MKNVTIAIDEDTHRKARIYAAAQGTSLSALVKNYLIALAGDPENADSQSDMPQEVREMPKPFTHMPPATAENEALPPGAYGRFPDGTPYYTKDGKPRKPGVWTGKSAMADDFDEWPQDILASFEAWPYDDPDYDPLPFSEDQLPLK